ncbi:hypothetical protein FGIG_01768 [Fasciola gigantica]|uniref:Uncharacterized protein n=1 Tax=Fasciola gigantica TaxID=46835 RepID=A0A504YT69_FASGI|nr:hypothetical protein FGIG_01768 [Fasciola gigantica]
MVCSVSSSHSVWPQWHSYKRSDSWVRIAHSIFHLYRDKHG